MSTPPLPSSGLPLTSPATPERIAREWAATECLPLDERERAQDILVIKYGPTIRAMRDAHAIDTSPNVIRLSDARTKLPLHEG